MIPGSSKKKAIRHIVTSYATSPPRPLTSMLKLWEFEVRTKMAVFFEGLEHRLWITTLRLGVTGEKLGTIVLEWYMAVFFEEPGMV